MKSAIRILAISLLLLTLTSCNYPFSAEAPVEVPTETNPPASSTPENTEVPPTIEPSPTPKKPVVTPAGPETIALDFAVEVCSAHWTTNASPLPCPGHLEEKEGGYVEQNDHTVLEGMVSVEAPMLIGIPGSGYPAGLGLFGRYPSFLVYPGDTFYATIACQGDVDCSLEFALEYYDAQGKYFDTSWSWKHKAGDGPQEVKVDLSSLAGQTVEFSIVMRAPSDKPAGQWGVWVQPYIARDPNAQPAPTVEIPPTPEPETESKTPGVISGMVAMQSAPPYLLPSKEGGLSSPVAVVFFNLDDGTYWWIHSSLTAHPYYQMTVSPGSYHVVAYAKGVGGEPYVAAGYTGKNPSCGKELKTVTVPPNGKVENIVIADWNWTCNGTAYRPAKPGGVPLP